MCNSNRLHFKFWLKYGSGEHYCKYNKNQAHIAFVVPQPLQGVGYTFSGIEILQ